MMNDDSSPTGGASRDGTRSPAPNSTRPAELASPAGDSAAAEGPPVWFLDVDGVLNIDTDELAIADVQSWPPGRELLLAPDPHLGLTVADLDLIEAFARGHKP
ncbi:hypothetical protein [Cellulomonas wangsupingiae]|uniref:Uncharacterized protein n=1 Tax=Cellulomonas wangsupingiae TaxID=2968085 RepID=A0ABY5K418_9CELL|nr:hypothetical protein [Cellulomonas wangsupingiae]MCC2333947.1 hypothetical protein [Cellulomonas wangsupingiae]UUI65202.1 hypothetical protein NP075_00185 [Cellulomonas wangsupingiae]